VSAAGLPAGEPQVDDVAYGHVGHLNKKLWEYVLSRGSLDAGAQEHVSKLRARLEKGPILESPQLVTVRGVFYPAVLLTPGIWDRPGSGEVAPPIAWRTPLQDWLFSGFEEWAPSWDINAPWDGESDRPFLGQLGHEDEAFSLLVAVTGAKAGKLRDELIGEGEMVSSVELKGSLIHRKHARATVPARKRTWGKTFDYCLRVDLDQGDRIEPADAAEPYSGYLWECVSPKEWIGEKEVPDLVDSFFVWEHTDFASPDARDYGLEALAHKRTYIERRFGELELVQKSAPILPGTPLLATESFYAFVGSE
jgi:hypothetical protein